MGHYRGRNSIRCVCLLELLQEVKRQAREIQPGENSFPLFPVEMREFVGAGAGVARITQECNNPRGRIESHDQTSESCTIEGRIKLGVLKFVTSPGVDRPASPFEVADQNCR